VLDESKTIPQVARDLDLMQSALRTWVERAAPTGRRARPGSPAQGTELSRLRKEVRELRMEREILKKDRSLLRERASLRFVFIDAEKATCPIELLCRALRVSRAGYYAWRRRPPSLRSHQDVRLAVLLRAAHERSRKTYGSPRVHAELRAQGVHVGRKHVAGLIRNEGLRARLRKRYRCTTMSDHDQPVAPNIFDRRFEAEAPNQRWVGDVTEILTGGGKLYLAVILDLFSRMVVGWALGRQRPAPGSARA
jgi:HTH-like domain/Integrase core domain/Transposase